MGLFDDPVGTISDGADAAVDMGGEAVGAVEDAGQQVVEEVVDEATDAAAEVPLGDVLPSASGDVDVQLGGPGPLVTGDVEVAWAGDTAGVGVEYGRGTVQVETETSTTLITGDTITVDTALGTDAVGAQVTEENPGFQVDAGPLHVTLDPVSETAGGYVDPPDLGDLPAGPDSVTVGLPGAQADVGPVHVTLDPVEATIPLDDPLGDIQGPDVEIDAGGEIGGRGNSGHVIVTGVDDLPDLSDSPVQPVVDVDGEIDGVPGDGAIGVDIDLGVEVDGREVGVHGDGAIVDDGEGTSGVRTDVGVYTEEDGERGEAGVSVDRTTSGDETQVDAGVYVEDDGTRSEVGVTQTHTGDWDNGTYDPTRNDEGIFVEQGGDRTEIGVTKSENEDWAHDTERGIYVEVDGERTEVGHSEVEPGSPFESASGGTGVYVEQGDERWDAGRAWKVGDMEDGTNGIRVEVDPGPVTVHAGGTTDEDGGFHDNNGVDIDDPAAVGAIEDAVQEGVDQAAAAAEEGLDEGWEVVIDGIDTDAGPLPGADGVDYPDEFPDEFPELPDDLDVSVAVHDPLGDVLPSPAAAAEEYADAVDVVLTDQPADDGSDGWEVGQFDDGTDDGTDDDEDEDDGTNGDQGLLNSMGDAIGGAFGAVGDAFTGLFD